MWIQSKLRTGSAKTTDPNVRAQCINRSIPVVVRLDTDDMPALELALETLQKIYSKQQAPRRNQADSIGCSFVLEGVELSVSSACLTDDFVSKLSLGSLARSLPLKLVRLEKNTMESDAISERWNIDHFVRSCLTSSPQILDSPSGAVELQWECDLDLKYIWGIWSVISESTNVRVFKLAGSGSAKLWQYAGFLLLSRFSRSNVESLEVATSSFKTDNVELMKQMSQAANPLQSMWSQPDMTHLK